MKILLMVLFTAFSLNAFSQTNNTTINGANSITINNGNVIVGKIIITTSPGSRVLFKSFSQTIDTLTKGHKGEYKTVFDLIPPDGVIMSKIITLIFDKPIVSCELKPVGSGSSQLSYGSNKEKTGYRFAISQLMCSEFQFVIYSKEKIFTKIDGLTGQVTQ